MLGQVQENKNGGHGRRLLVSRNPESGTLLFELTLNQQLSQLRYNFPGNFLHCLLRKLFNGTPGNRVNHFRRKLVQSNHA